MRKLTWVLCAAISVGLPAMAQQSAGGSPKSGAADPQAAATQATPAHPVTVDQVHEMLEMTGASNLARQLMENLMPLMRQSMPPYMPADVLDDLQKSMLSADLETPIVKVYQENLSTDDGAAIIAFYKTPAGKRYLSAMPRIAQASQAVGQQIGRQVIEEVIARHQPEIDAAEKKYEQDHPTAAPQN